MNAKTLLQMTLAALMLAASGAYAQVYVGGGGGWSRGSLDPAATAGNLSIVTGTPTTSTAETSTDDLGWKVFLGYDYNQHLGFEFGFANLGKYQVTSTNATPNLFFTSLKLETWYLDVLGKLPLDKGFSLYARLGGTYYANDSTTPGVMNIRDEGVGWKGGLGAQYDLNKNLAFRAEWERYMDMGSGTTTGRTDVDLINAQILWKF